MPGIVWMQVKECDVGVQQGPGPARAGAGAYVAES